MATTGGKVGNLAGNVALAAPTAFIPGANTYTGAAAVGGALGLLQPTTTTQEGVIDATLGAGAGAASKFAVDKTLGLIQALRNGGGASLTPGQQEALKTAEALGFKVTPGQRSGSKSLSQVEAALESMPESSGPFNAVRAHNDKALGRIAAASIGENADNVSTSVLANADARLGKVFDSVADGTKVPLDPQVYGARLKQALQDSDGMLNNNASLKDNGLFQQLDKFVNTNGGATREQLRTLSSNLGRAAKNNMTSANGDRELGIALNNLKDTVEDAIQGTLTGEQAAAYGQAREQYRNLMNLTARNNIVNPSSGKVNGQALANALMSKDKGGFTFGGNDSDLYNAARFVQAFPKLVGDSGTATRAPFSVGQIPARVAGAVGSRWYTNGADMLTGATPNGVPSFMYRAATTDPLAKELARLLMQPGTQKALPALTAEAALQGRALVNPPQQ
jgi:hypothetical protein